MSTEQPPPEADAGTDQAGTGDAGTGDAGTGGAGIDQAGTDGAGIDDAGADDGASAEDGDTRRQFREALARKQQRDHLGSSGQRGSNQHPHAAPAKRGRTFRRKSG